MARLAAVLALVLALFAAPLALADDDALKAQLQARYDELSQQLDAENWDAVRAMEAPEYRSVDTDGTAMTAEEELDAIQQMPPLDDKDGSTTVVSVRLAGDLAYVEQRVDVEASMKDMFGKAHAVETHARSSDIWKLVDGQWLILQTVTNEVDTVVDGTNVSHKVRPVV